MRSMGRMLAVLPALLALSLARAPLAAQVGVTTDIIAGRVTDAEGAPLAGVRIQARSLESGVTRTTATRADGRYLIAFSEGGGRYTVTASTVGRAPAAVTLSRLADEDVLTANFRLTEQAVQLEAIEVTAERGPPPTRGDVGGQERNLSGELVNRLPLEDNDPARLAALAPGVVAVAGDSADGRGSFSVAGQRASQNQITLDGASFSSRLTGGQAGGGSPLSVPQEGVRGTQVVTNTYDVSRGQFAGGLVATVTRSGTNRTGGSFSWQLRDPMLQGNGNPSFGSGYTQNRVSGGFGGPIVRDRFFYYLSFTAQRRTDQLFALSPDDPASLLRLGVTPQAVDTFLNVLSSRYGVTGRTGTYARTGDALSLLGRLDWVAAERHTLALRGHVNLYDQDNARIGFLETLQNGGEQGTRGAGAIATLTSRFGAGWVNELRTSFTADRREQTPYERVPEGRVRVSSVLQEGRGFSTLVFGGERSLPSLSRETTVEVADELSVLFRDTHRLKAGVLLNLTWFEQEQSNNRLGSFEFASLDDFAEGRPFRFTRQLAPRATDGSGLDAAAYLGDTWRPRPQLQVTYGLRLEHSRFGETPARNPRVEEVFGMRTDRIPGETHLSPRAGFSWRLSEQGAPLRIVRGGFGEFRGRAPYSLFAAALEQTGLPGAEALVDCVGPDAVPVPDWGAYEADPSSIPTACRTGGIGMPAQRTPNVTVFEDGFGAPRSWRASLGYQTQLLRRLGATFDVSHARGVGQFGVRDLNLRGAPAFLLASEGGRPVYAPAETIEPRTGTAPLLGSRVSPEFAHAFALASDLESSTTQVTVGVNGLLPPRIFFSTNYTWSRSRDQSSFNGGSPVFGFAGAPTRGDPNRREWATSDFERRHSVNATLGVPLSSALELTFIGRANSGTPFTPMVGADVNGDGARNDVAFVFDPAAAAGDTALAAGMQRLLSSAPDRIRDCLAAQTGELARRNSCRGEWSASLDLRTTFRPNLRSLGRRLSVSLDAYNLAAGLDELFNGGNLRGWGQSGFRPDDVLLVPAGFDAAERRYLYRVNENFGSRRTAGGFGGFGISPFQVQLSARVTLGPGQQGGGGPGGLAGIAFGGFGGGGFRGGGGPGGPGGPGRAGGQGGFDPALLLERALPEPISPMILLRDTLRLTDEQVARLQAIADTLDARNAPIRERIRETFAASGGNVGETFGRIQPQLDEGRRNVQRALDEAQQVMTPEQWRRVPAALRNALGAFGGPGARPGRPSQQRPPGTP